MMSHYTQASIIANKFVCEEIISYTKDLHNKIFKVDHENTLKNILDDLYMSHKNSACGSYEKQYYAGIINQMCDYVCKKCNVTKTNIYETWLKFVFDNDMEITPLDNKIGNHLKDFIFANVQTYQIIFEHNDKNTRRGRYYYVFKIEFNNTDKIKMYVSIQDLHNDYYTPFEKGLIMIPTSSPTEDGFIQFDVSNETLLNFAKYIHIVFDNCGFTGGFELYPQLSLINNSNMQEYVNNYIATCQINKKFLELLVAF